MKKLFIALPFLVMLACGPEDATPDTPTTDTTIDTSMATLIKQGVLMGVGHTASGTASIYDNKGTKIVYFDPFSSQNGPDLKVYLSKDVGASDYLRLGQLQSTSGGQSYAIPSGTDLTKYNYVHIWCEKYSVEFARAELK